jgi:hypothetical protein
MVNTAVNGALERIGSLTTGVPGALFRKIPGTEAADLDQFLTTVKANVGFDKLQQMRETSPTGGALGQVSDRELKALQSVIASLSTEQSPGVLKANLAMVKDFYDAYLSDMSTITNKGTKPSETQPEQQLPIVTTQEDFDALESGDSFIENGQRYRKP